MLHREVGNREVEDPVSVREELGGGGVPGGGAQRRRVGKDGKPGKGGESARAASLAAARNGGKAGKAGGEGDKPVGAGGERGGYVRRRQGRQGRGRG